MADFANSFTGKNSGVLLPSGEGVQRAQQNLNDLVTRAEEMKYKTYRENRDQFIKNSNIDPVFVLSDAGRKYITQRIGDFNKRWGKRFQESGGNLSDKDLLDMQTDKNLIIADQQNQKAQMEKFIQHRDLVSKNPDKFDDKAFAEATRQYMETGVYDQPLPAWRPIDFGAFARDMAQKQAYVHDEGVVDVGGGMMSQESWNMPQGTEGRFLVGLLGQNPQADVDFFSRWDKADKERYFKLADANKDNKTSPDEEKNAIALWAKDEFGDVRLSKSSIAKGKPGAGREGMSTADMFGSRTSYKPTEAMTTRLGQTDYSSYHTYNKIPTWDIPVGTPIRILDPNGEKTEKPDTTVSVDLTGYDEDRDEFKFIVKSDFKGLYGYSSIMQKGKDWRIAIKRADLPKEYSGLEIMRGGKVVKIGEVKGTTGATSAPTATPKTNVGNLFK